MIAELGATSAVFPPDENTRDWLGASSARTTSRTRARRRREYDERVEIDLDELGPAGRQAPQPRQRRARGGGRGHAGRAGLHGLLGQLGLLRPRAPGRGARRPRTASSCTSAAPPPPRPARARSSCAIAESGVYRQLVEGGVRMLEPVCGPCVGMGQAPPSDANSLRTFNRNFPGRWERRTTRCTCARPRSPRCRCCTARSRDPREYGDPPELLETPELKPYVDDVHIFAAGRRGRGRAHRDPARAEHQDRRPSTRRSTTTLSARIATVQPDDISTGDLAPDGVIVMALPLEHPRDRRVHLPAPRPRVPQAHAGVGRAASSSAATTTARARRASTRRWRRCSSGVQAVFAKSFARIHRRNLVAQGILALTFADEDDYELARVGDTWTLPEREAGARGGGRADQRPDRGVRPRVLAGPRLRAQGARDPPQRRAAQLPEGRAGRCLAPAWIRAWCASGSPRWRARAALLRRPRRLAGAGRGDRGDERLPARLERQPRRRLPDLGGVRRSCSSGRAPPPPTSPAASRRRSPSART